MTRGFDRRSTSSSTREEWSGVEVDGESLTKFSKMVKKGHELVPSGGPNRKENKTKLTCVGGKGVHS